MDEALKIERELEERRRREFPDASEYKDVKESHFEDLRGRY